MIVKEIPEYAPSYWERLWEVREASRRALIRSDVSLREVGHYPHGAQVPKGIRRYCGIGCPHQYFKDCNRWSGCTSGSAVQCVQCWDRPWQGESLLGGI